MRQSEGKRMTSSNYPQWSTPERRTRLLKLWARYNNQCLSGHQACTNPAHYVQTDVIMGYVSHGQAVKRELCNSNGQQLKFNDGTPAYYIDIPISKKPVQVSRTIRRYDYLAESIIKEWIRECLLQNEIGRNCKQNSPLMQREFPTNAKKLLKAPDPE